MPINQTRMRTTTLPGNTGAHGTPGTRLARAAADIESSDVTVDLDSPLLPSRPPSATRRPESLRHLLNVMVTSDAKVPCIREQDLSLVHARRSTRYEDIPETGFVPALYSARLTDLHVEVPLPDQITEHPDLLAAFVDHRVLAHASILQDQILLHGSSDGIISGLLSGAVFRVSKHGIDSILDPAIEVEENGGTCDGIVVHPDLYWRLAKHGLLAMLDQANVRICRTRMIRRGQALLGDFHTGAALFESATSTLTVHHTADGARTVRAHGRISLAMNRPQHFVLTQPRPAT